jgi:hypothetical protein
MQAEDAPSKLLREERRALEQAKEAAPVREERGRDMRERVERESR